MIVFSLAGFILLRNYNNEAQMRILMGMSSAADGLREKIVGENRATQEKVGESLRLFSYFLRQSGKISEESDSLIRQATNFSTGETYFRRVPRWTLSGKDISHVQPLIDNVYSLTGTQSALYQKIPEGYVLVASNFNSADKNQLTDVFIPNDLDIIPAVENGEIYSCNMEFVKKQYVTSFFPLFVNSKISGMISCFKEFSIEKQTIAMLKNSKFALSGYSFLVCPSAKIYIHPEIGDAGSLHSARVIEQIKSSIAEQQQNKYNVQYFTMPDKGTKMVQTVRYIKELDTYVGVCCPERESKGSIINSVVTIAVLFGAFIIAIISVYFIDGLVFKIFYKMRKSVMQIAKGTVPEKYGRRSILEPKEIKEMENLVNEVAEKRSKRLDCIEKISNGDYTSEINVKPGNDLETDLLVSLRNRLSVENQEDIRRKTEEKQLDWINKGITKFVEILRFHGQDRGMLAYNIISNLVKYVDANQGAIYFTDDEDPEHVMLEMAACYAYEKQKLISKRVSVDEGLLGRAYHEARIINITDLPEDYIHIVSGLGGAEPTNLIIVPLIFNQHNSGMLEIASFKVFKDYEITFLSRIAESIASAISGLKITERTETLLQQSQEQSKLMKIQEVEMRRNLKEMRRLKIETENKEMEMRGLFHAIDATSLVTQYDKDGTIIHVNSRVTDLFQMPEEELIGKNHCDVSSFTPENKEYRKFWDDLRAGSTRSLVESVTTKQKVFWLSETFSPIMDEKGNVLRIINIGMDISETKVLERQLRRQEREILGQMDKMNEKEREMVEKQKYIEKREAEIKSFENALDTCVVRVEINRRGIILRANKMFKQIVEQSEDRIINHDISDFLVPETVAMFENSLQILATGKEIADKLKLVNRHGKTINLTVTEFPILTEKGDVDQIMIIGMPVK